MHIMMTTAESRVLSACVNIAIKYATRRANIPERKPKNKVFTEFAENNHSL